ncbi:WRKY transcription factor 22-like [Miscanthus floridulus]|uniref:WRKY transcription factor 22-like n=1 Tax=Miscanthus floridulus TaxID=154761 RepID=UPI003459D256
MRACGGRGALLELDCQSASAKSQPPPPPPAGAARTRPSASSKAPARARSWFMRGVLLLMAEHFNDWDLQAVVRSCGSVAHPDPPEPAAAAADAAPPRGDEAPASRGTPPPVAVRGQERAPPPVAKASAALLYDLEYLDLDRKPFLLPVVAPSPRPRAGDDGREREVMISFPAGAASTSGMQQRASPPGRKPGARTPRQKRSKKSQLKKVVREMPVADGGSSSSDPWAWRKYGQKPIKGSPYPRGYYKCSSMKGCMARKLVERSPAKPGVLIVTYMAEHCHPVPTQLNALAGTTRHKTSSSGAAAEHSTGTASSPTSHEQGQAVEKATGHGIGDREHGNNETSAMAWEFGGEEIAAIDDDEFWPAGMDLDELLAPVDDDVDFEHVTEEEDGVLGRRLSL